MKIEYLHRAGGFVHQGPSGTSYEFNEDAEGKRVAEVKNPDDQARFLSLTDARGNALFAAVKASKKAKEADTDSLEVASADEPVAEVTQIKSPEAAVSAVTPINRKKDR